MTVTTTTKVKIIFITLFFFFFNDVYAQRDLVISGGNSVSSFVCGNRQVYTWGNNEADGTFGILGAGSTNEIETEPQYVDFGEDVPNLDIAQVSSGSGGHFVALDCNSSVWAWGGNNYGQVGNGESENIVDAPARVDAGVLTGHPDYDEDGYLTGVEVVYSGNANTFAILGEGEYEGRLVAWGSNETQGGDAWLNNAGQLGDGTTTDRLTPVFVENGQTNAPLENVTQIFAGDNVTYALVDEDGDGVGTVYSWGAGENGTLGRNADGTGNPDDAALVQSSSAYPVVFADGSPLNNIVEIQAGDVFGIARDEDGYVWTWGHGAWANSTGNNTVNNSSSLPARVLAGQTDPADNDGQYLLARSIGAGQGFGMAVTLSRKPVSWGGEGSCDGGGFLGDGTTDAGDDEPYPPRYITRNGNVDDNVTLINRGDTWGFYGTADNQFYAWGCNAVGQLGIGNEVDQLEATLFTPPGGCDFQAPRPQVDLSPGDTVVCESSFGSVTLQSGFLPPSGIAGDYAIEWERDGNSEKSGTADDASMLSLNATEPGEYTVTIEYIGSDGPCGGYDPVSDVMIIDVFEPTFELPTDLNYCDGTATVNANPFDPDLNAVYYWFTQETGGTQIDTTIGDGEKDIDVSGATPDNGEITLWVEERGGASGAVLTLDQTCDDIDENGNFDVNHQSGFVVNTTSLMLDSVDLKVFSNIYTAGESQDITIEFGIYGATNGNGGRVADEDNLIRTISYEYTRTREAGDPQGEVIELTVPILEELPQGEFFISPIDVSFSGGQAQVRRGGCAQNVPVNDNVTGDIIQYFAMSQNFQNAQTGGSLSPGYFFNVQFSTPQQFCDRLPVTLEELCPCARPEEITIDPETPDTLCLGEDLTLSVSVTTPGDAQNGSYFLTISKDGDELPGMPIDLGSDENPDISDFEITGIDADDAGEYTFSIEDGNSGTASCTLDSTFTLVVLDPDAPDVPEDFEVCSGEDIELSAEGMDGAEFSWTGPNSFTSNEAEPEIDNATTNNDGIYEVTQTVSGCESNPAEVTVTVNETPELAVTQPDEICAGESVDIPGLRTDGSVGDVTYYDDLPMEATNEITVAEAGQVTTSGTYYILIDNEGCTDSAAVGVTVNPLPTAEISGGGTICDDGTATAEMTITFTGSSDYTFTYNGSTSGDETVTGHGSSTYDFESSTEETFTITSLTDGNDCEATSSELSGTAEIDYHPELEATYDLLCDDESIGGVDLEDDEFQIRVTVTGGDAAAVTGDNGVTFTDDGGGVWYSGAIDEDFDIDVTVEDDNGCSNVEFEDLNQRCSCPVTASSSLDEEEICSEGETELEVEYSTAGSSTTFDIEITQPDGTTQTLTGESGPTSTFDVSQEGSYSIEVTGIDDDCAVSGGAVTLSHFDAPTASISDDETICDGEDTELTITFTGESPYNVSVLLNGSNHETLTGVTSPHTLTVDEAGDYTLEDDLIDANGCEGEVSGTATITTITPPVATMLIPASGTIEQTGNEEYDIEATDPGAGYTLTWSITSGQGAIADENAASTELTGLADVDETTSLMVTVSDDAEVCPDATDEGSVERVDQTIADAGSDETICEGTAFNRTGNGLVSGGIETAEWNHTGGADWSYTDQELTVEASTAPGTYTFEYSVYNSVQDETTTDEFELVVIGTPEATMLTPASGTTEQTGDEEYDIEATDPGTGYTLTWSITGGQGAIADENAASTELTGLVNVDETTNLMVTVSDDAGVCPDDTDNGFVERVDQTIPDVGPDSTICEGTTFTRTGDEVIDDIEEASWSNPDNADIIVSADGRELTVENTTAPGTYNFVYTVENDFNPPATDDFTLTIHEAPTLNAFGANETTCESTVPLEAPNYTPAGATLIWSVVSGPGSPSFNDNSIDTPELSGVEDGTTTVSLIVENGVCPPTQAEELEIEKLGDITEANITLDGGHLYDDEDVSNREDIVLCVGENYTLRGAEPNASDDETGEWEPNSGTLSPTNTGDRTYTFTPDETDIGTSRLTWVISNPVPDCDDSERYVEMEVFGAPDATITNNDGTEFCEGESINLEEGGSNPPDFTREWTSPLGDGSGGSYTASNLSPGTHTITFTVDNPGCIPEDEDVTINVDENRTPSVLLTSSGLSQQGNNEACETDGVTYTTSVQDVHTGDNPQFSWEVNGSPIGETSGSYSPSAPLPEGPYQVTVTIEVDDNIYCYTDDSDDDTYNITVYPVPSPELTGDTIICETDAPHLLQANVSDTDNNWRWLENGVHVNVFDNELTFDVPDVGTYDIFVEETNNVCPPVNSDTVTVQIDQMPMINILSNRYIGMVDEDLPIESIVNPYDSVMWTHDLPYNVLERPDSVVTLVNSPEGFVDERFVLYVYNGECMDTAGTDVTIRTPVRPYNSFTPNGDAINDTWTIEGIETYTGATIRVYNRWGNLVHEQLGGYTEPWDGTRNGNELPVGTYYYIIDLGDASTPLRGDVTIVR